MRVFSQINNCQQKQKQKKNKSRQNKKRGGAPLLGLAKSIYYSDKCFVPNKGDAPSFESSTKTIKISALAPAVQRTDNFNHWISRNPAGTKCDL